MPHVGLKDKEYVLKTARDLGVKFIRLWFTDILGFLKNVAITIEELEEALEEGVGFDGSSIEGFTRSEESELISMPARSCGRWTRRATRSTSSSSMPAATTRCPKPAR